MEATDASVSGSNAQTTLNPQDIDKLYEQYQKQQSESADKIEGLYREYTKSQSEITGKELREDPSNPDKYNAYKTAVKSYYEAHGPQVWKEMLPDSKTGKNILGGLTDFAKGIWEQGKTAITEGQKDAGSALSAAGGVGGGILASGVDLAVMPFSAASWFKEKNLAGDGKYDEAAEVAAERLRDLSAIHHKTADVLKPSGPAGAAAYEVTKPVAGLALPLAGAKVLGAMSRGAQAAEAGSMATAAGEAAQAAPGVLERAGRVAGAVTGGTLGARRGLGGVISGAEAGAETGAAIGKKAAELGADVGKTLAEGGAVGAVTTGAEEPAGTPVSRGVGPGVAIAGGMRMAGAGAGKLMESYREGRGEVAPQPKVRQPGETSAPEELFRDFDTDGGKVNLKENRVAVETKDPEPGFDTGRGVGRQSRQFKRDDGVGLHESIVKSYENTQGNTTHSTADDVIRYGYDPETQTLQVVMSEPTKGDAIPINRYVYRKVTPEMFDQFSKSESKSDFMNSVGADNQGGVTMTRVSLSDRQLNALVDSLNSGKLDFDKEWGFTKGSGEPRETPFSKPAAPVDPNAPIGMTPAEKESWLTQKTADIIDTAFGKAAEGAGAVMRAGGKFAGKVYGAVKRATKEEPIELTQPLTEERLQSMREARAATGEKVPTRALESLPSGEQQALPSGQRKALAAAPETPAATQQALPTGERQALPTGERQALPTGERQALPTGEKPALMEPAAVTQRRKDVEAALAEKERQDLEQQRVAEEQATQEERLRQSPAGKESLKRKLSIEEKGLQPTLRTPAETKPSGEVLEQGTEAFNQYRSQIIDEFRSDGIPINRDTVDAATELARTAPKYRDALRRAIYQEFAPKQSGKVTLKSFEELPGQTPPEAGPAAPAVTPPPEPTPAPATRVAPEPVTTPEPTPEPAPRKVIKLQGKSKSSDKTIEDINKLGFTNPFNKAETIIDNVGFEIQSDPAGIRISSVWSLEPGKGNASKALDKVLAAADANGATVTLSAKAFGEGGLTEKQLKDWYARRGFEESSREQLVRKPSVEASVKEAPAPVSEAPKPLETAVKPKEQPKKALAAQPETKPVEEPVTPAAKTPEQQWKDKALQLPSKEYAKANNIPAEISDNMEALRTNKAANGKPLTREDRVFLVQRNKDMIKFLEDRGLWPVPGYNLKGAGPAASESAATTKFGAVIEKTPEATKVEPTPAKEQEVSQFADKKQLAEQKKYLTSALATLAKNAPENPVFKDPKVQQKYDSAAGVYNVLENAKGSRSVRERNIAEQEMDRIMEKALDGGSVETATIKVPGDGTFRIPNAKRPLEAFADKVESKFGTGLKASSPTGAKLPKLSPEELEQYRMPNEPEKVPEKATEVPSETMSPAQEKALNKLDDMRVDDVSKSRIKTYAKKLVKDGLLTEKQLADMEYLFKDRDMGAEDVVSEITSALIAKKGAKTEPALTKTNRQYWTASDLEIGTKYKPETYGGMVKIPIYTIIVDGKQTKYTTEAAFSKALKSIYSDKPKVFINAGKGVTVNFDRD